MPAAVRDAIQPGSSVDRYHIVGLLSAGGMGEVYRAMDPALERELVLKVLSNEAVYRTELLERFIREARAASALNHPNIVTIYEIGEAEGRHFIAMELVRGRTLRDIAKESVPVRTVARIGAQAARALAIAHAAGIVHRDIKPENIMMRDDGYVKVLDFGIARLSQYDGDNQETTRLTAPGMVVGTMRYMSPEQATAAKIGPPSDLFSLGIVLYELATGRHPFHASSDIAMLSAIILREPQPASQLNPRIPPELDALLLRMLSKEPALRPAAAEVETALGTLRDPESGERRAMTAAPAGSPEIVGRNPERMALRDAVASASAGRAIMMCVSGEAGIGKTTLVETFVKDLPRSSIAVARGRCSERLAGAEAYLPIL
ncbi:MAG TPA: serine/threonine-protein kinase, partial [Gemmatimonadaceae bacterium]